MKPTKSDRRALAAFMAPALVMMLVFFVIPVLYVITVSVLKWNGISAPSFNGMKNFALLFKDKAFTRSIVITSYGRSPRLVFRFRWRCSWRSSSRASRRAGSSSARCTLPAGHIRHRAGMLWRGIYNADYGLLNGLLKAIGLGHLSCDWLGGLKTAFPAVLIYWVFYVGYYMVIMMADITTIDQSYYEAATIDGASDFQQAIYITIPLIKKTSLLTCVTLASIMGLRQFEQVYMLTNGQPANTTSTMVLYLYKKMQDANYGLSSATAVILIIVGILFIICIRKLFEGRSETVQAKPRRKQ